MITFEDGLLLVDLPRQEAAIKELLGGRWDSRGRGWKLPPISLNVLQLVEWYGEEILDDADDDIYDLAFEGWGFRGFNGTELTRARAHPSWDKLYEFQREGVEYLVCNPHLASLVGLSWGLGKAATAIVAADLHDAVNVLVLAPLTLAPAWIEEWQTWSQHQRDVKRATKDDRVPLDVGVTIANHEVLQEVILRDEDGQTLQPDWVTDARRVKQWIQEGPTKFDSNDKRIPARERVVRVRRDYLNHEWDLIIVDESVMLKNRRAVKTDVLMSLRKKQDPIVWELSASPTTKFRDGLFRQLQIMFPRAFTAYWRFTEFFCLVNKDGWGWTIEGDHPDHDPQYYLRDLLWIKSEEEAGIELPEYIETPMPVEANTRQRTALDQMIEQWIVDLEDADEQIVAATWLARSLRLQQITSNMGTLPKVNGGFFKPDGAKLNLLRDLLDRGDLKPPLLVWTWFIETTKIVEAALDKHGLDVAAVTGQTTNRVKDETLADFKAANIEALVLQMGVGKFGHTFTKTRSIYYHDRTFDSDAYVQSRRRVRRIGLAHRPTLIVPKIKRSADELIDANLDGKVRSIAKLTNANLASLLRSL